jgi:hypothetical protein
VAVWIVSIPKMNDPSFTSFWQGAIYYAKVSVALGVAAILKGLPAVVTGQGVLPNEMSSSNKTPVIIIAEHTIEGTSYSPIGNIEGIPAITVRIRASIWVSADINHGKYV